MKIGTHFSGPDHALEELHDPVDVPGVQDVLGEDEGRTRDVVLTFAGIRCWFLHHYSRIRGHEGKGGRFYQYLLAYSEV